MKLKIFLPLISIAVLAAAAFYVNHGLAPVGGTVEAAGREAVDLGKVPLYFEKNLGQTASEVEFLSRGKGFGLFLTRGEAVLRLERESSEKDATLRMSLVSAQPPASVAGERELAGKANYFIGNDRAKWRPNVPTFEQVRYSNVYAGVDQIFYGSGRELEYDFIVRPGVDPAVIAVQFTGAESAEIEDSGDLVLSLDGEKIRQQRPVIYQEVNGERRIVEGRYIRRSADVFGFEIGEYDRSIPLVIDPVLVYSTYLGGSDSDVGHAIAVDSARNVYVTGYTTSVDFPTLNPVQPTLASPGRSDMFVTKLNAAGTAIVYSTYVGGSVGELAWGIDVDNGGNAYVTGTTGGTTGANDFPVTPGAFDTTFASPDSAVLFKLGPGGNTLAYSTYINAQIGSEVKVDRATGEAVIAGRAGTDLQTTPGAFRTSCAPSPCVSNAFVTKFNASGSGLVFSTYIGPGNAADMALDPQGNVYLTGGTISNSYPITPGAIQPTCRGCEFARSDAFITKLNNTGSALIYSTYLGGSSDDSATSITADAAGNAYVTGAAASYSASQVTFPTTPGAYRPNGPGGFLAKINTSGSQLVFSTYLPVSGSPTGIAIDPAGNSHMIGTTRTLTYFVFEQPISTEFTPGGDHAFLMSMNSTGTGLLFSSLFGPGAGHEIVSDNGGNVYVTGLALQGLTPLPTMNPVQANHGGGVRDGFIAKLRMMDVPALAGPFDFDGDRKTDLSVFRGLGAVTGEWWLARSSDGESRGFVFGSGSDQPVPADFTGDGKTDVAFFRPSTGSWFVLRSEDSSFFSFPFGANGDVPVPADFDADGKADPAVFRPSSATWFINKSTGGTDILVFGTSADQPVVADYDGDAKADIAIYRPLASGGEWWLRRSSTGVVFATVFGTSADRTVQGDYTGDGKADIAFFRPSNGNWFVLRSEDLSFFASPFGSNGDIPVPGDYDGDGKNDAAVFRPSSATWFANKSAGGTLIQVFGSSGDLPLPSAYVK